MLETEAASNNQQTPSQGCWPLVQASEHNAENTQLAQSLATVFKQLLVVEKIEAERGFLDTLQCLFIPLCRWLVNKQSGRPLVIGINGAQGAGKSTLTRMLTTILEQGFHKKVVSFSIDDLYKSREQRARQAQQVHPLFATRGVPGSHDVELCRSILNRLISAESSQLLIPQFDKACDDRRPEIDWMVVDADCDLVIFEGWCVGSIAQNEDSLATPVNQLERQEDPDGIWRNYVNQQLLNDYAELFSMIDILVMLKIPDFEKVYQWRQLQENKLKDSAANVADEKNKIMTEAELEQFIMHYERITRYTLQEMPQRADIVLELGDDHQILNVVVREEG